MKVSLRFFSVLTAFSLAGFGGAYAHPDFDVHPRNLENALGRQNVRQDTLRIDNVGNELLTWVLEVEADVEDWLSATPDTGSVGPGGYGFVFVRMDGQELDPDHYYGNIHFTSNDPTRETYDVPVAGHTTEYPRIEAGWAIPQQGEWWGIDMDRIVPEGIEWGRAYSFNLNIRNRGTALLDCDTIICNNGYYTISPGDFNLNPGGNSNVNVTLNAVEVGGNSGTITSVSNAWNPRELNFRITATVNPAFRMGSNIPDTSISEDAPELLVADLDTVFIASDAGTELTVIPGVGITTRLARNKELFIRSRSNWNGNSSVALSAALGDSILRDTFLVRVNPVADPPEPFDLISPVDGDTLYYDGGDSLFIWQETFDPDQDTVYYDLKVYRQGSRDTVLFHADSLRNPECNLRDLYLDAGLAGQFEWTVAAVGGGRQRDAWSTFLFTMTAERLEAAKEIEPPRNSDLISIFPSPFNGRIAIIVRPVTYSQCRIEIFSIDGRSAGVYIDRMLLPGVHSFDLNLSHLGSGSFVVRSLVDGEIRVRSIGYLR